MLPRSGAERRRHLRICALASGLGDKAVSLLYERVLRKEQLALWVERCQAQIADVLKALEAERARVTTPYWLGDRIGHADVVVACVVRFTREAHPLLFETSRYPALSAHADACEAQLRFADAFGVFRRDDQGRVEAENARRPGCELSRQPDVHGTRDVSHGELHDGASVQDDHAFLLKPLNFGGFEPGQEPGGNHWDRSHSRLLRTWIFAPPRIVRRTAPSSRRSR